MSFNLTDTLTTTFLDTTRFEVTLSFPKGYNNCDTIVVHSAEGLTPFTYIDGELKTFEATVSAYVTPTQNKYLEKLYKDTMHPGYVDQRYPISLSWGLPESLYSIEDSTKAKFKDEYVTTKACYLSNYVPPTSIDYGSAEILSVELTLREI